MGTNQQLTTEQLEILILLNEINIFKEEISDELTTDIQEIIVSSNIMSAEEFDEVTEVLAHYGYIDNVDNYEPTIDGVQYLRLFKEHLEVQEKHPVAIINNQFSLINTLKIDFSLFNSICGVEINSELVKNIIEAGRKLAQRLKQV